jgi:hypothetical protein
MNEILYCVKNVWGTIIARDMTIDVAMTLTRALFDTYFNENGIEYTIKRQDEEIIFPEKG